MKRIVCFLVLVSVMLSARAQFPRGSADTLKNYNNRFIDNNSQNAFTNLRLHNLLGGIIDYATFVATGGALNLGMDTAYMANDSLYVYRKNGVFKQFVIRGSGGGAAGGIGQIYRVPFSDGVGHYTNDSNFLFDKSGGANMSRLIIGPTVLSTGGAAKINSTADNMNTLALTAYGTGLNTVLFRRARGTIGTPTPLLLDDDLFNLSGRGYSGSAFTLSRASIYARATQDWTDTTNGTQLYFGTTSNDSTNMQTRMVVGDSIQIVATSKPTSDSVISGTRNANGLVSLTMVPNTANPGSTFLGTIYQKGAWANLNDFTINGATASISTDSISVSGGTNDFTKTIDLNYYTLLNRWKQVIQFRVLDNSSTSYGIGLGLNGTNAWSGHQHDIVASVNLTNTGASGFLILSNNVGNGTYNTVGVSSQNLVFSAGDMLELGVERKLDSVIAYVRNISNPNSVTAGYRWLTTSSANPIPNTGKFAIYAFGGTQTIDSLSITSTSIKNADIAILGDSKSVYYASQYSKLFGQQLGQQFNTEVVAGPGDRTPELLTRLPEIKALSPKQVLIQEFSNDLRSGMTFSQSIANINIITDSLSKWGIPYYFIPFYETSLDLSQWNSYFLTNYSTHYINTWGLFQSGFLQDGIHPTAAGHDTLAKIILNAFKLKGGSNRNGLFAGRIGAEVINGTPGSVLYIDPLGKMGENNSKFYWDNTLSRLGIGTTAPTSAINVVGSITTDTVYGGSTSGDSLRLMSTSHASKGRILFGSASAINDGADRIGLGTINPAASVDIRTNSNTANGIELTNTSTGTGAGSRVLLWNETRTTIAQFLLGNSTSAFSPNGLIINTSAGKVSLASLSDDITFGKSTTINGSNEHARFKFNGNFLVGTTTDNGYRLQVNGAISTVTDSGAAINTAWIDTDGKLRKGPLANNGHTWAQTNSVVVSNTTTETSILSGSGAGSLTILPAEWSVGKTFSVTLYGTVSTDGSNPGTTTFRGKLGSTNICATTGIFQGSGVTDRHCKITITFTCRSTGASGTVFAQGQYTDQNGGINVLNLSNSTATIDMTANQIFDLTLQWSQAAANNTLSSFVANFTNEN